MKEADIDGYVKWFTFETEWAGKWDAPWENKLNFNVGDERKSWEERFDSTKGLEEADRKWKFEIEVEGKRIGWVNSYYDLEDFGNSNHIIAPLELTSQKRKAETKAMEARRFRFS